jgi:hypothetical protein
MTMRLGTKSVLLGAHQFILHPLCLAVAWWRLYGFPWKWQLWLCFLLHDAGYVGCRNIDGEEGQKHPVRGAHWVGRLTRSWDWHFFCLYHSRHYAKANGQQHSRLCVADKLAFCITPRWLYLTTTRWTGELDEYLQNAHPEHNPPMTPHEQWCMTKGNADWWHYALRRYLLRWVAHNHKAHERHKPAALP